MNVVMEVENQNQFTSHSPSQKGSSSSTPDVFPPENYDDSPTHHSPTHHSPRPGTVIPNRIFVGGIDCKVNESDLRHVFSQHGAVKEVKIVLDYSGLSKGYGFVTFESKDDALKVLRDVDGIYFKDKKLSIGQAVRKHHASGHTKSAPLTLPDSAVVLPTSCGTLHLTTSTGYPYTYHNGVAYFQCPNMSPPAHHWPSAPPVMHPRPHHPVYQQPACHYHQCAPNQYQWNVVQTPVPSSPVVYSQQEYLYQPADGGPVQPPLPVMEDATPEFVEPMVQQVYPLYPPRTEGMTPIYLQHDTGKMFPHPRVHLKPKHRRYLHHKDYHYLPAAESPDASMLHTQHPLM